MISTLLFGRKTEYTEKTLALLGACCLFLSAVEYMIPKPLPFMRIGLANLPVMLAVDILPLPAFLTLICIKVLGQALITGTLFSYVFLFSVAGTVTSAIVMYCLRFLFGEKHISFIGIGTAGAVISNVSQLALARVFIFKENTAYITPLFLFVGLVTGIALGIFCEIFSRRSIWLSKLDSFRDTNPDSTPAKAKQKLTFYDKLFSAKALCVTGLLIMPALLFNPSTTYRVYQFLFLWFLVWLCGKKLNFFLTIFTIVIITAFNLIIPYGQVLYSLGPLKVTLGSLTAGIHRAVTFVSLIMLSKLSVREDLKISGSFGELLSDSLLIFSTMIGRKKLLSRKKKSFVERIDALLLELNNMTPVIPAQRAEKTAPGGYVILAVITILSWLPILNYAN
jgi:heptaprenyl diphosphate synthase